MPKLWRSGHVVIPKALRDKHDIHPGDEVQFVERDGAVVIRKVARVGTGIRHGRPPGVQHEPTA